MDRMDIATTILQRAYDAFLDHLGSGCAFCDELYRRQQSAAPQPRTETGQTCRGSRRFPFIFAIFGAVQPFFGREVRFVHAAFAPPLRPVALRARGR